MSDFEDLDLEHESINVERRKFTASNCKLSDLMEAHAQCKTIIQSMQRKLKEYISTADKAFTEYAIKHLNENDDQPKPVLLEVKDIYTKNKKLANKMLRELNLKLRDLDDDYADCEELIEKHNNQTKNLKNTLDKVEVDVDKKKRLMLNAQATKTKIVDTLKRFKLTISEVVEDSKNSDAEKIVVSGDILSLNTSFGSTIKSVEDSLRINKALSLLENGAFDGHLGKSRRKRPQPSSSTSFGSGGSGTTTKEPQPSSSSRQGLNDITSLLTSGRKRKQAQPNKTKKRQRKDTQISSFKNFFNQTVNLDSESDSDWSD